MAYRRRRVYRRKPRRRMPMKKKALGATRKVNLRSQVHFFNRWVNTSGSNYRLLVTGSDASPNQYGAVTFALTDLPSSSDFTNLFDQYKIYKIQYRFMLEKSVSNSTSTYPGIYPRITFIHDFNSTETPSNEAELLECGSKCRSVMLTDTRPITRWFTLKPAIQQQIFNNGSTYTVIPSWKGFLDTDDNGVAHFGIRYAVLNNFTSMTVKMQCQYFVCCKSQN